MTPQDKLFRFAQREFERIQNDLILPSSQGYSAFGSWEIHTEPNSVRVYKNNDFCGEFSSAKVALSYCIAENEKKYALSIRIQQLDQHYLAAKNSLQSRKNIAKTCRNNQTREILLTKIQHRSRQQIELEHELEDCVKMAKYFYLRGLNNETHRIGCAAPTRAS